MAVLNYRDPNTQEWVPIGTVSSGGGGLDQTTADSLYVNTTGDTMTGPLTLPADPTEPLHAATKGYVDAGRWTQATTDPLYVNVAGDTITGNLVVQGSTTLAGVALGGAKITGVGNGTAATDAATYGQLTVRTPPIIVLGATDPVPPGTAAGTVVMRTP